MPTLIDREVISRTRPSGGGGGETAQASEIAWMRAEFAASIADNDQDKNTSNDSSTLSGSMLLAALEDMKQIEFGETQASEEVQKVKQEERKSFRRLSPQSVNSRSLSFDEAASFKKCHASSISTKPIEVDRSDGLIQMQRRKDRKMGPNEHKYIVEYKAFVEARIQENRNKNPNLFPNYLQMDKESREQEQDRVLRLLHRIGIANSESTSDIDKSNKSQPNDNNRFSSNDGSNKSEKLRRQDNLGILDNDISLDNAMPTLSSGDRKLALALDCDASTDCGLDSSNSIELCRGDMSYESPDLLKPPRAKRYASTSGKRGADSTRSRVNDKSVESYFEDISDSQVLETSMRELALADDKAFTASQSPIVRRLSSPSCSSYSPRDHHSSVSFGDSDVSENNTPLQNDSINETTFPEREDLERSNGEGRVGFPSFPSLKEGNFVHFEPLEVKFHGKPQSSSSTQKYANPIRTYPDYIQRRLGRICTWLEKCDRSQGNAVVLSLSPDQTIDTILKVIMEHPLENSTQPSFDSNQIHAIGCNLIVSRTKDDLEMWSQALREKTSFSVLNHASVPLKERKTQWATEKRTRYDVVLTTFDALKMPDVNVVLDSQGMAVINSEKENNGWYESQTKSLPSEIRQCKQLTVLHRIRWKRLICIDLIGRKSYLVKAGTSRVLATRAINADTRFLFFGGPHAEDNATTALIKSDKSALRSIARVLGIHTATSTDEVILRKILIDFNDDTTLQSSNNSGRKR